MARKEIDMERFCHAPDIAEIKPKFREVLGSNGGDPARYT